MRAQEGKGHEFAVFLGGTSEDDETNFTIGVEFERRLGGRFGLGVVVERIGGRDAWVFLAPLSFRPARHLGLKLYAGPGLETRTIAGGDVVYDQTWFVVRTGVGWAVEVGRLSLTPQVELNFGEEFEEWKTALVFGVAVGFRF